MLIVLRWARCGGCRGEQNAGWDSARIASERIRKHQNESEQRQNESEQRQRASEQHQNESNLRSCFS